MSTSNLPDSFNQCFFENVQRQIDARRAILLAVRPDMDATEALFDWLLDDEFQQTHVDGQLPHHLRVLKARAEAGDSLAGGHYKRLRAAKSVVERFNRLDAGQRYEIESAMWYFEPLNQVTLV
ncbi:MAG: hypothetical protein WAJ85_02900 [Candidatus Baltobacteraceae bacterium]